MSKLSTKNGSKSLTNYMMAISLGVLSSLACVACGYNDIATEGANTEVVSASDSTGSTSKSDDQQNTASQSSQRSSSISIGSIEQAEGSVKKPSYLTPETVAANLKDPVNDFTGTLTLYEIDQLNTKLRSVYNSGIMQAGVVLVATTDGMPIFDYAMQVAESWELGSADENDGLLIMMAVEDRQMYILTGLGIEHILTDKKVAQVIDNVMTPNFKQAQYAQGLSEGVDALVAILKQEKLKQEHH
ncbi:TPM domain-containing protein [Psychrobacter sp. FDAARGOS_221]|uniref:TPM domain-containing protein n=1 Tax=Psychrobacter sp. FDAARGOS_221 TaxID=1975705 RepID=UPI000BB54F93|nr:TPM domain-containing protein [Psychrobacter sp. FDAARGOS_221]PNK60158.1 TPM domain-containing protein [Psychrobacter sp. FDAARGOS_221]